MSDRKVRVPLVRASKLLWLPVLLGGALLLQTGSPHILFDYTYTGGKLSSRYMISCRYLGRHTQVRPAINGECPWIAWLTPPVHHAQ